VGVQNLTERRNKGKSNLHDVREDCLDLSDEITDRRVGVTVGMEMTESVVSHNAASMASESLHHETPQG
jgi:hypothetical protein